MISRIRILRLAFLLFFSIFLLIACSTFQVPTPDNGFPTFDPNWTPVANTISPTVTALDITEEVPTATSLGIFKPGDPTATPLGNDITDPNFIQGVKAYEGERFDEVIRFMSAAIETNPNLAPAYRYRGSAYWHLEDCVSGLADEEKAVSINPDYARAWADHALMNYCLENYSQALLDSEKALSIDPSLAFVHHNLAFYYYKIEDYENALEEYSMAVAIDPSRASAWNGKSEALTKLGRYDECILNSTKAIEVDPEEWLAYADRAYCEANVDLYPAAVKDYEIYVAQGTTDAAVWYNLGIAQRNSGDIQGAIDSYTSALDMDPSYYQAYINRGNAYRIQENYQDALADYNCALEFGDIPLAYSGRGDAYFGLGKFEQAITDYETTLSLFPFEAHTYCQLALSYFEVERYQESIDAAESTRELDPSCGGQRLFEIQARSYYALGNYDQALVYIDKALSVHPYSLGYYYRGIILHDARRYDKAIQDLEQFLSTVTSKDVYKSEIADANSRLTKLKP